MGTPGSDVLARVPVDPSTARVYEHGWQSWSPTSAYRLGERPARPVSELRRVGNYRPDRSWPGTGYAGEGLLAVDPGTGDGVHVFGAPSPDGAVPSVSAVVDGDVVVVSADGPVDSLVVPGAGLEGALARWGEGFAQRAGVGAVRPAPTAWCSWYHYFTEVTQADVEENLAAMDDLDLDVEVVQIDDGYQAELGDWLTLSDRFTGLDDIVSRIRGHGRRAGIWVAPFFLGGRSATFRAHPDWVVGGADPGTGWDQQLHALDVTHPAAEAYLRDVFGTLRGLGIDYFKVDFLFAGAMDGRQAQPVDGVAAYRHGLRIIREAIGEDAYLLGCGAPILPSVGLVDAMRVGPDISHSYEPADGDLSQPSQRAAAANTRQRAWQHGRFWVNDSDCLVAGPHVERREEWADVVERYGGLRSSSDRLRGLDDWGLETTRRLLHPVGADPFVP
ncbi:MAG: glycoside hydrolase family 36 protein [Actinomycetes bacterium]